MEVPDVFMQRLANYLTSQPYCEVAGLLAEMNQIAVQDKQNKDKNEVVPPEQKTL